MNKKFLALLGVIVVLFCGCVKVNTYTHERVDLEPTGNQGYIVGTPPFAPSSLTSQKPDRKVLQVEVTLPGAEEGTVTPQQTAAPSSKSGSKTDSPKIK